MMLLLFNRWLRPMPLFRALTCPICLLVSLNSLISLMCLPVCFITFLTLPLAPQAPLAHASLAITSQRTTWYNPWRSISSFFKDLLLPRLACGISRLRAFLEVFHRIWNNLALTQKLIGFPLLNVTIFFAGLSKTMSTVPAISKVLHFFVLVLDHWLLTSFLTTRSWSDVVQKCSVVKIFLDLLSQCIVKLSLYLGICGARRDMRDSINCTDLILYWLLRGSTSGNWKWSCLRGLRHNSLISNHCPSLIFGHIYHRATSFLWSLHIGRFHLLSCCFLSLHADHLVLLEDLGCLFCNHIYSPWIKIEVVQRELPSYKPIWILTVVFYSFSLVRWFSWLDGVFILFNDWHLCI